MEGCSGGPVTLSEDVDLDIYTADVARGDPAALVSCLLSVSPDGSDPEVVVEDTDLLAVVLRTPFYTWLNPETWKESPAAAALIRNGDAVHVVQTSAVSWLKGLVHVRDDMFVITSGYATHDRNYLFRGTKGEAPSIRNGSLQVENSIDLLFRLTGSKSFWIPHGAFWFDAIVDRHGKILDIMTRDARYCMSLASFADITRLDLSRVSSPEVCVWGTPPPAADAAARPRPDRV